MQAVDSRFIALRVSTHLGQTEYTASHFVSAIFIYLHLDSSQSLFISLVRTMRRWNVNRSVEVGKGDGHGVRVRVGHGHGGHPADDGEQNALKCLFN